MRKANATGVFTKFSRSNLIAWGSSPYWRLNRAIAEEMPYFVAVRSTRPDAADDVPHYTAFLVCRGVSFVRSEDWQRWLICFKEYAEINVPKAWPKKHRYPVVYFDLENDLGIDPDSLDWKPVSADAHLPADFDGEAEDTAEGDDDAAPLALVGGVSQQAVVEKAKEMIADAYNTTPDRVKIQVSVDLAL